MAPVLTKGDPVAGQGVERSLPATTDRADGTIQVTYNDHPLYFYAHEGKREVKCHDIFLNGGNWYVVQPGGDRHPRMTGIRRARAFLTFWPALARAERLSRGIPVRSG